MNKFFSKKATLLKSIISLCFLLLFCSTMAFAQGIAITGTVTDESGPLPGVNITVKGTVIGAVTNADGKFQITVPSAESVLIFSFVGYNTTEMIVGSQREINIELLEDSQRLEEVVVIGYGVLKKKMVTGATIQVAGESLQKMSTTSPLTALQGQTPGVNIMQTNGQPGSDYIVHIRGIGTNGEARPLYVVDGVPAGRDAMNHMNAADIESIDILKDAASAAIYGSKGSNGVVLITTKQGKAGKPKLTYDGYYGAQYMAKKPDMLNAKEYIQVQNERLFNMASAPYDWEKLLPYGMYDDIMNDRWKGTDWVDAFYNKGATTQGHAFSLTGGNEYSKFSIGYSYTQTDGIFGEAVQSKYDRHTVRINSDHVLLSIRDKEIIKIGQTLNYSFRKDNGIATGNMYWNSFTSVLRANPLMPVYNADGGYYDQYDKNREGWLFQGAFGNPIAAAATSTQGLNLHKNHNLRASAYLQIQPLKNLMFKSQLGLSMSASSSRDMSQIAYLSTDSNRTFDSVSQSQSVGFGGWALTNSLTYTFAQSGHTIQAQAIQEIEKSMGGENVSGRRDFSDFEGMGWDYAWLNNFIPTQFNESGNSGSPWDEWSSASFLGRLMYNFRETYIFNASLRADGSSNFASGHRWGYFPALSAGWILSNESFMQGTRSFLDFLKLTASWGQNGLSSIDAFQYITRYEKHGTVLYYFGDDDKGTQSTGVRPVRLKNPNISWEKGQMLDLGFDARLLNSRFGVQFNYYIRDTKDWLLDAPISATWGIRAPTINGGSVQNKGVELMFTWNDRVGDVTYSVNLNGSYNKSEVKTIDNAEGVIHGSSNVLAQGTGELFRLQVGYPMGIFYGWKADGIFQNEGEVASYKSANGELILPNAKPGDVRFKDLNGDGKIDEGDKTMLGCPWAKYQMGFQLQAGYKGFDFMVAGFGKFGLDIAKSYRSFYDSETQNYTTQVFERWHGEGTSNKWPRLTNGNHMNYGNVSDIFLEKGDYVKIQNITLGYDFKHLFTAMPLGQCRFYVSGLNLFTITGYSGMDPENGFGDGFSWMSGIDLGLYPASKTFMVGLNVTF